MVDLFVGIILGSSLTYIGVCLARTKKLTEEKDILASKVLRDLERIEEEAELVVKPDNKKVRYFTSPEYKRERAFIEEQKAKKRGSIEYD